MEEGNTQTIIVQVEPAPPSAQNMDLYLDMFWAFFGALVGVWCWKKIEHIFSTNNEN